MSQFSSVFQERHHGRNWENEPFRDARMSLFREGIFEVTGASDSRSLAGETQDTEAIHRLPITIVAGAASVEREECHWHVRPVGTSISRPEHIHAQVSTKRMRERWTGNLSNESSIKVARSLFGIRILFNFQSPTSPHIKPTIFYPAVDSQVLFYPVYMGTYLS
jgi:hypothetical protein